MILISIDVSTQYLTTNIYSNPDRRKAIYTFLFSIPFIEHERKLKENI